MPTNRTPKNSPQAPDEKDKGIHSSILPDAEDFGDERREQRVVPAGGKTVEHDESQPEREGGRSGGEDAGEPEGENAACGKQERQDKRVLPAETVTGVAGQDARDSVDGVTGGEEVATSGGGEAEDYGVGRNKGEGELSAGRLEGVQGSITDSATISSESQLTQFHQENKAKASRVLTWRNAATAEKRNVGLEPKARETWVLRLSGPSAVELAANRLRGTDQATGNPAIRLKPA